MGVVTVPFDTPEPPTPRLIRIGNRRQHHRLRRFSEPMDDMDAMLQLPDRWLEPSPSADRVRWRPDDVEAELRDALARVNAPDFFGDAVLAGALDAVDDVDEAIERLAVRVEERLASTPLADASFGSVIYDCAAEALAEGRLPEARIGLTILLDVQLYRPLAMLGLAVCAARLGRPEDALNLALGSREGESGHPRAFLIAGHSESRLGHFRQAQRYLAMASRLARHRPGHDADLQMAQRLLLSIQIS